MRPSHLKPGSKVRLIQDGYDPEDIWVAVTVTANSTGRILSFREYSDHLKGLSRGPASEELRSHLLRVGLQIRSGACLPVAIETFAPLSDDVRDFWAKKGYSDVHVFREHVVLMDPKGLELIE